jgi:hypothetical protein
MKLCLQLMLIGGLCWLGYTNMHLLDKATVAVRKVQENTGTKLQMSQIARCVQMEYLDTNTLPKGDITKLIVDQLVADGRQVTEKSGKDTWGNPYWSLETQGGFCIVSAGPDGKWRTRDDIYFQQSLTGLGYRAAPSAAAPKAAPKPVPKPPAKTAPAKPVRKVPLGRCE